MHRNLLRCIYPDSDLVASDIQDSHLDVIANAGGFLQFLLVDISMILSPFSFLLAVSEIRA